MLAQGWRLKRIASVIGMDPTSVSKGIERNRTMVAAVDGAVKKGVAEGKSIYAISRSERVAGMPSQSTLHS